MTEHQIPINPRPTREQLTELFAIHGYWKAVAAARINYQALMHARKRLGMACDQD